MYEGFKPEEARSTRLPVAPEAEVRQAPTTALAISDKEIRDAEATLKKYKDGKANLEKRIVENEQWYKLRHWEVVGSSRNPGDPEPVSAWLLNSIANKHADAMDNYPNPTVLPRERDDEEDAKVLSSVLPTVLEQNGYERTYSDMWWYKLKTGTGVVGVYWDSTKQNGLGDIDIRQADILNLFWEPGVKDIQKSRNLFHVDLLDREALEEQYPALKGKFGGAGIDVKQYRYDDTVDVTDKVAVIDWYYKRREQMSGNTVLHYCKFANGQVLFASENMPEYAQRGYYDHGKYPFIFDALFPEEGTPAGFGYIDVCKSPQLYIDKLDQTLLKHAVMGSRPRFFIRGDGQVNEQEFADWTRDFVHFNGSGNPNESIMPVQIPALGYDYTALKTDKINELKETSGNRDFNQGGTVQGVTAASAIAALQEAGSKLSRDIIKSSYMACAEMGYLCIELMRQFYTEPRMFRIVGKQGEQQFVQFSNQRIQEQQTGDGFGQSYRMPYFDIRIVAQKASPFSTVAQNERAKEMFSMGFFRADMADQALACLSMMQFEGIEGVREKISENGTLYQQLQQLTPLVIAMAQQLDALQGTQYTPQVAQILGMQLAGPVAQPGKPGQEAQVNPLGDPLNGADSAGKQETAGEARKQAARNSTPA